MGQCDFSRLFIYTIVLSHAKRVNRRPGPSIADGERVSDKQMKELKIEKHDVLSDCNYKLTPSKM